jgi:hypothetical protein
VLGVHVVKAESSACAHTRRCTTTTHHSAYTAAPNSLPLKHVLRIITCMCVNSDTFTGLPVLGVHVIKAELHIHEEASLGRVPAASRSNGSSEVSQP